jgi:hypothetical protein
MQILVAQKHEDSVSLADSLHELGNQVAVNERRFVSKNVNAALSGLIAKLVDQFFPFGIGFVGPTIGNVASFFIRPCAAGEVG